MIAEILAVGASPWAVDGSTTRREVHLKTEIGLRSQYLSLHFNEVEPGQFAPMFMILMNYVLAEPDPEKPWFGIRFCVNDLDVAVVAGRHKRAADGDALAVFDGEELNRLVKVFSSDLSLKCEVIGEEGILTSFPIPADAGFSAKFDEARTHLGQQL